ncbi:MAG: hypothetical protein J6M05_02915 [Cardiobacteriaceae bacterium]|nr:hypothetical protein [Cardiobacteriaceae bacterium]
MSREVAAEIFRLRLKMTVAVRFFAALKMTVGRDFSPAAQNDGIGRRLR